jgi:Flp pilus assembly protein TadG
MRIGVAFGNLRSRLRSFAGEKRGNVMVTFALATIPMIGFVGAAVDYSRANSAKAAMQSAVDATALILSKEAQSLTTAQLNTKADAIFKALLHRPDVANLAVVPHLVDAGTGSYKLTLAATATVPTAFTKFVGQEQMNLSVSNEIVWGIKKLELVLALDVTGSMASNNKMTELKKAAKSLLTTMKGVAKKDGDVKVAIIPFSVDVNVGTNNVNAAWLDWSDWAAAPVIMTEWLGAGNALCQGNQCIWERTGPGARCPFTTDDHGFRCTNGPASTSNDSTVSRIPSSGAYSGWICPSKDNGSKSTAATGRLNNRYHNGCYTRGDAKPESDWHPVTTGFSATCGGLPFSQCQCTGSGSNRVCGFRPDSNWQPYAQSSSASCGNLSMSDPVVCKCFDSGSSKVCKQKTYYTQAAPPNLSRQWRPREKTAWNGCVRDRNQDYDTQSAPLSYVATNVQQTNIAGVSENYPQSAAPATSDAFQPHQFSDCSASLMPLSFEWTALSDKIDALQPIGNTNVGIGLAWGFHALTAGGVLGAATPSPGLDKVIILLTDGENTQNRYSTSQADIDTRTKMTCDNVKKANIKLYTIRVINGNASLLQTCASKSDMYYNVQDASQLNDVFTQIAKNLANLRIAK